MDKFVVASASAIGALFLASAAPPPQASSAPASVFAQSELKWAHTPRVRLGLGSHPGPRSLRPPEPPRPLEPPPPPTPKEALKNGVLIVVSLPSQRAFVLKKGQEWDSTDVSTGKRGNETPKGVFPILQKKVEHRSTLYDDAPMPYMQRLTWDGVALHAGRVPGYPASHGCIRLPKAFAQKLFVITNFSATVVIVTDQPVGSAKEARKLA